MAVFEHRLPPNLMVDEIFSEIAIVCGSTKEHIIFPLSIPRVSLVIPSGKRLHNYGNSPCLMGKLTINGHVQ